MYTSLPLPFVPTFCTRNQIIKKSTSLLHASQFHPAQHLLSAVRGSARRRGCPSARDHPAAETAATQYAKLIKPSFLPICYQPTASPYRQQVLLRVDEPVVQRRVSLLPLQSQSQSVAETPQRAAALSYVRRKWVLRPHSAPRRGRTRRRAPAASCYWLALRLQPAPPARSWAQAQALAPRPPAP